MKRISILLYILASASGVGADCGLGFPSRFGELNGPISTSVPSGFSTLLLNVASLASIPLSEALPSVPEGTLLYRFDPIRAEDAGEHRVAVTYERMVTNHQQYAGSYHRHGSSVAGSGEAERILQGLGTRSRSPQTCPIGW